MTLLHRAPECTCMSRLSEESNSIQLCFACGGGGGGGGGRGLDSALLADLWPYHEAPINTKVPGVRVCCLAIL